MEGEALMKYELNDDLFHARAVVAKALGNDTRLKILHIISEHGEKCVCDLTNILGISQPLVSKHLSVLKNAGIVLSKKEGLNVVYYLAMPCVLSLFSCIDDILLRRIERRNELFNVREG